MNDTEAEKISRMDTVGAEIMALPEQASDDLKPIVPPLVGFALIALQDGRDGTRELNTYMANQTVAQQYQESLRAASKFCPTLMANQ